MSNFKKWFEVGILRFQKWFNVYVLDFQLDNYTMNDSKKHTRTFKFNLVFLKKLFKLTYLNYYFLCVSILINCNNCK